MSAPGGTDGIADVRPEGSQAVAEAGASGGRQTGPDRTGPNRTGPARPGSARPGSARPGSARPGSARTVLAGVLALLFLALAAYCTRRGIVTDTWPAFLPDTDSTSITRYQGPWLSAAAVALLGAGLSIMALIRRVRAGAGAQRSPGREDLAESTRGDG